jgi:hypothetical protein
VRRKTFALPVPRAGEGCAKKAAANAITFPLTAAAQVPKSRYSADLSEQLAGA